MELIGASNPKYVNADHSAINCDVCITRCGVTSTSPYTSTASDDGCFGAELWEGLNNGLYGDIAEYNPQPSPHHELQDDGTWLLNVESVNAEFNRMLVEKRMELTNACHAAIVGGFTSAALNPGDAGANPPVDPVYFSYDSRETDQANNRDALTALELNGGTFPIVCNDSRNQNGFIERPHTLNELKRVCADFAQFRLSKSQALTAKIALVDAVTMSDNDLEAVQTALDAINW